MESAKSKKSIKCRDSVLQRQRLLKFVQRGPSQSGKPPQGPRFVDTGTKGKGDGDSTSSAAREKQPRDDPMEAKTSYKHTLQAADKETLIEPEPAAKGDN
jgi:hypothetical protein